MLNPLLLYVLIFKCFTKTFRRQETNKDSRYYNQINQQQKLKLIKCLWFISVDKHHFYHCTIDFNCFQPFIFHKYLQGIDSRSPKETVEIKYLATCSLLLNYIYFKNTEKKGSNKISLKKRMPLIKNARKKEATR